MDAKRATSWLAVVVLLVVGTVYFITLYPSVPFWDAGEFIAVSKILGIPHPPGTPFYVLVGRIATMVPLGDIAQRINGLSAVAGILACVITYLTIVRLIRRSMGPERKPADEWIAHAGGLFGAFMLAFSDSFWENSIEAEVYALMSLAQIMVFWLGLKWWEAHDIKPTSGPLLVCVYIMWVSVGMHLGVGIMGLPLLVMVWFVDRRAAQVFAMPFLSVLLVTMGLEKMAGGVLALSAAVFIWYALQKKLNMWLAMGSVAGAIILFPAAFQDSPITPGLAALAVVTLVVPLWFLARVSTGGRIIALALLLMVAGYSTHAYLPIRAAQSPAINEGNPDNWDRMRDLLERRQYGQMNMTVRRAPLSVQLDKEFWRYFKRQWPLWQSPGDENRLVPLGALVPLLLGLFGAVWQMRSSRAAFLPTLTFVGMTTAGMIVFLNFSPSEVRERDYFFQSGYHAYSLWMGLGAAWLILWVRDSFSDGPLRRGVSWATVLLILLMPFLLLRTMWFTHDRRGNYVAFDYARNMLMTLAPNSFIFTNGDNDTFPLWYMQEVEEFRKDVRVVNLSLLNTDWYIRQLRDEEPKVPIALSDAAVDQLGLGAVQDSTGRVIYTNEFMVRHIMQQNRKPDRGWKLQPYWAVTVPNHYGFEPNFSLEGLVYRVNPDSTGNDLDLAATEKALYEQFQYRGLFLEDGTWDPSVYKDENASTLSRNYAAAHLQLAFHYRRAGNMPRAISEMERVSRMFPDYTEVLIPLGGFYLDAGDTTKAIELFRRLATRDPNNAEARYYLGIALIYQGQTEEGVRELENTIQIDPNHSMAYYAAYYSLKEAGQMERAVGYLERWISLHPTDAQARQLAQSERAIMSGQAPRSGMGRPPLPPPQLP
jgi:DNA-binding SARP family transcriptional activator